ncbi:MAG: urea transporter permease UrtC [Acidimicrobiia bacterium]|nr:urea transporter permease UrtC [Acidimicrobiia bacterium]
MTTSSPPDFASGEVTEPIADSTHTAVGERIITSEIEAARRSPMSRLAPGADNPWAGRVLFVVFALGLWFLPVLMTDPARIREFAQYLCYAMVAVGVDIAWGYGGMLALGQGVFFGLGAYCMGMYLTLQNVPAGSELPSFMSLYGNFHSLPMLWRPFQNFWVAAALAVLLPMVVATLLGLLVFRRRIRGPFFALLTQATALVFSLILIGNLPLTAGFNGLTGFTKIFGKSKYAANTNEWLFHISAVALLVVLAIALWVVHSRFGKLLMATRDSEDRVRFLGYDPAVVKTVAFAISAGMAGLAGALAAPVIGIVAPNQFTVLPSILMVCWVAVGGRGTLWGAVLGALLINWGGTRVSEARPDDWTYVQGLVFVIVLAWAPGGLMGIGRMAIDKVRHLSARSPKDPSTITVPATLDALETAG